MRLRGAQAIVKVLLEQGTDTVFGYPGGAVIPLYDALYDAPLKNVLTAHEQGAIHAADGYARASGRTGVCIATSGPGATNIVTGLATAYLDSVPLVAITGQVAVNMLGRDSFQEIDIVGVTMPITKYNTMVRSRAELLPALRRAFRIAREGRPGPVLVDIPSSIQLEEVEWLEAEESFQPIAENHLSEASLRQAAEVLAQAHRPLLLVGGGAVESGASAELVELAIKLDLPVVHTLMGKGGFPASDSRCLGLTGMHGHIAANMAIANADVLIAAGSRFSDRVTGDRNRYAGKKTIIQLDIDPSEIDKNVAASIPLMGDLQATLRQLLPALRDKKNTSWWKEINRWRQEDEALLVDDVQVLTAPWLMRKLSELLAERDTYYVTDVGQHQMWAAQHLIVDKPRHHMTSGGCGTMGFGLPAALGAAFARPEADIVHICGDGGFKMTGMELYTVCCEKKKILSIVVNNSCLGMVRQWQQLFYNGRYSSTLLPEFDFTGFAASCGSLAVQVTTKDEFISAVQRYKEGAGTMLIEAVIDRKNMVEPMVAPGAAVEDFVRMK
ncbi:MAG: biosynthetic-type acetolactate synthase large subunit [Acidaminococcaceae bacterium]|nr:biosynthetic-type acetolactate synthase large subunit [Acidaminococcaceae bacterium]